MHFLIFFLHLLINTLVNTQASEVDCNVLKKEKKYFLPSSLQKTLSVDEYFQLPVNEFKKAGEYDYLVFKLKGKSNDKISDKLFVTIQDGESKSYWTQLNHVTEVQKGEFFIYVDLKQLVGERGSQKKPRRIDFSTIKKVFLVLNPEKKGKQTVHVSQFHFLSSMHPKYSSNVFVFDFRFKNQTELPCIKAVDENDVYTPANGYGFKSIKLWKKEDSQYLDPFLSSVLYAHSGEFLVDLENGTYEVTFFWNSLGYWAPPFYSQRKATIEDIPLLIQDRSQLTDYERDYFVFENKGPNLNDHPWDWLYLFVMKPITKKVVIKDKTLNLEFSGDNSAVGLNGLIITKANNPQEIAEGKEFLGQFKDYLRGHYSRKVRSSYEGKPAWKTKKPVAKIIQNVEPLNPFEDLSQIKTDVSQVLFSSAQTTFINLLFQNPFDGEISYKWTGKEKIQINSYKGHSMWVSLDRNHESYTLETQILKKENKQVQGNLNQQFVLEFSFSGSSNEKIIRDKGELIISVNDGKNATEWKFPLEVVVWNQTLPPLDFQVGFIGLNSLRYSFYSNREKLDRRRFWDREYLKLLSKYGFNTFTGLPTNYETPLGLSYDEVEKFILEAKQLGFKPPYYTYGGEFLHKFFEENDLVGIQKEKKSLNQFLQNPNFNDIVFQFSDEAAGYSNTVTRDLKRSKFLKENFRSLRIGGFSHWNDSAKGELVQLNQAMDVPSYSEVGFSAINWLENNEKPWGLYNQVQGNREDPYPIIGRKLWSWSRKSGFSHYLEWHTSAIQNLPYFDLDGREADVAIAFPSSKGHLNPTIKFIQAAEGLQDFRWLSFVSSLQAFESKKVMKIRDKFGFRQKLLQTLK